MTNRVETLKIYLLKCLMWWLVIAWVEMATVPATNKSDPWFGVWFSLLLICVGAYKLAKSMPKRWIFIYGCGCSLSLIVRLHSIVTSWEFLAIPRYALAMWLIGLTFALGLGCYFVAWF